MCLITFRKQKVAPNGTYVRPSSETPIRPIWDRRGDGGSPIVRTYTLSGSRGAAACLQVPDR